MKPKLIEKDYEDAAKLLGVEVACIKAVASVESGNGGFFKDDHPTILFEAHIFGKLTNYKYNKTNPDISSTTWDRKLYKGGMLEETRLNKAAALDRNAALQSASWGLFQIMGFNYKKCGFLFLQSFINAMYRGERDHLIAFCNFLKANGLDKKLRNKDWAGFALGYNGAGYKQNKYDEKLKVAYDKFKPKIYTIDDWMKSGSDLSCDDWLAKQNKK